MLLKTQPEATGGIFITLTIDQRTQPPCGLQSGWGAGGLMLELREGHWALWGSRPAPGVPAGAQGQRVGDAQHVLGAWEGA